MPSSPRAAASRPRGIRADEGIGPYKNQNAATDHRGGVSAYFGFSPLMLPLSRPPLAPSRGSHSLMILRMCLSQKSHSWP